MSSNNEAEHLQKSSLAENKRRQLILNGNLWSVILKISLPLIAINALTFIYTIIDSMLAAGINKESISAVVVISQITAMITALGTGFASGGMIIIARLIGRNDYVQAKKVANTLMTLAVIVAVVTVAIIVPLAQPVLRMLKTPESSIAVGTKYFIIQLITSGITVFNNIFLGLEKARGQTKIILLLNVGVMIIKVALSFAFLFGIKNDITMLSLATLIANLCLTAYVIVRLGMKSYIFSYSFKNKELSKKFLKPIFVLSFPIFLGRFVFSLGKVIVNAMCGHYGDRAVGALGVSNNMGGYVTNIAGSVEESAGQIISTNLGNQNRSRALKAFYYSFLLNIGIAIAGVIILTVFNDPIVNFYAKGDADYARMISDIFFFEKLGILALAVNSAVLALLYGFGFTKISMYINLSRLFIFRIPSLWMLQTLTNLGSKSIGIAMLISNGGIGLMSVIAGLIILKKIKREDITDKLKIDSDTKQEQNINDTQGES